VRRSTQPLAGGRLLRILGLIFLTLVVGAAIAAAYGIRQDHGARKYVSSSVERIYQDWDFAELTDRASAQLRREPGFETGGKQMFQMMSGVFGPLVTAGEPRGSAGVGWGKGSKAQGTYGEYHVPAKFKAGEADLTLLVVKEQGAWRIRGFNVESPLLFDAIKGRGARNDSPANKSLERTRER
jgi:hypothetical protein